jgi:hypothetical protein
MAEEIKLRKFQEYAGYIIGTGTSICVNEFIGEYVAQARAATGWDRFFSKAIPKSIFSGILLYLARQVKSPYTAKILDYMGTAGFGTVFIDLMNALFPGGITAAAAALALRGKTAAPVGAVLQRIGPITVTPTPAPLQVAPQLRAVAPTGTPGAGTF